MGAICRKINFDSLSMVEWLSRVCVLPNPIDRMVVSSIPSYCCVSFGMIYCMSEYLGVCDLCFKWKSSIMINIHLLSLTYFNLSCSCGRFKHFNATKWFRELSFDYLRFLDKNFQLN